MTVLHPVVLAVPESDRARKGRDQVLFLREHARRALHLSARKSGVCLGELEKDGSGAPLPQEGVFWSLTHKPEYVAGVVASRPVGIDLEGIRPYNKGLEKKVAGPGEWDLGDIRDPKLFFRYWTAKEAVLKVLGVGLKGLSSCRICRLVDGNHLVAVCMNRSFFVEHFYFESYMAALTSGEDRCRIEWSLSSEVLRV